MLRWPLKFITCFFYDEAKDLENGTRAFGILLISGDVCHLPDLALALSIRTKSRRRLNFSLGRIFEIFHGSDGDLMHLIHELVTSGRASPRRSRRS